MPSIHFDPEAHDTFRKAVEAFTGYTVRINESAVPVVVLRADPYGITYVEALEDGSANPRSIEHIAYWSETTKITVL